MTCDEIAAMLASPDASEMTDEILEAIEALPEEEALASYDRISSAIAESAADSLVLQFAFQKKTISLADTSARWNHLAALSLISTVPGEVSPENYESVDELLRNARRFVRYAAELLQDDGNEYFSNTYSFLDDLLTKTIIRLRVSVKEGGNNEELAVSFHEKIELFGEYLMHIDSDVSK